MKRLYAPATAFVFVVVLFYGYVAVNGIVLAWVIGEWAIQLSLPNLALIIPGLTAAVVTGLIVGIPFGAIIQRRPVLWAGATSSCVVVYIIATYGPNLFWAHYFNYISMALFFILFSWASYQVRMHLTLRSSGDGEKRSASA